MVNGANAAQSSGNSADQEVHRLGIPEEIAKFTSTTDSLVSIAPLNLWAVESAHRHARKELLDFLKTKAVNVKQETGKLTGTVPPEIFHEFRVLQRRCDRSGIASKVIARSYVVSLVSQYDSLLGGLIRAIFYLRPELLNSSNLNLTFKDLQNFDSISTAREFIVEKEVETVIRKSHVEHFEWLENKFGLKLREGLDVWPTFIEVTERRNLLVHCDGVASSQYLKTCEQNKVVCDGVTVGTELQVSRAYITGAYECLVEVGVKLAHVLWRKLFPDQTDAADINLNLFCLDLLTEGRNALAKRLLDFAVEVLHKHTEVNRLLFVVNRAQASKWLGDEPACWKILDAEDWSAVDDKLLLGVSVLKDDFTKAVSLMKRIGNINPSVPKEAYSQWPIFKAFRKSANFKDAYKQIFGADFVDVSEQSGSQFSIDVPIDDRFVKEITRSGESPKPS
jgi:hypothetical protein